MARGYRLVHENVLFCYTEWPVMTLRTQQQSRTDWRVKTLDGGGQEKDDLIAWCRVQLDDDRLLITWAAESDTPVIDNEQRDDAQSKPSQPYPLHHPRLPCVILVNKTGYTDNMLVL